MANTEDSSRPVKRPVKRRRMDTLTCDAETFDAGPDRVVEQQDTPVKPEDFVSRNGLLLVRPYLFDFRFGVKKRHDGRNIIDIFTGEFPLLSRAYVEQAFADARIRVQGQKVQADTPLRAGQCMRHFVHRHEPPVLDGPVQVLGMTEDVVAVSKPACTPVHVAGQHRKNTVCGRLQALRPDLGRLHPIHRLDKPVSGVLLLARSPAAATRLNAKVQGGELEKVYLARVAGVFPQQPVTVDVLLRWDAKRNEATAEPGATVSHARSDACAAKSAVTEFRRLAVAADGATSLVECRPKTGRSHQIRVHLQHAGHPIANDWQYGGRLGNSSGSGNSQAATRDPSSMLAGTAAAAAPAPAGASPAAPAVLRTVGVATAADSAAVHASNGAVVTSAEQPGGATVELGSGGASSRPASLDSRAAAAPSAPRNGNGPPHSHPEHAAACAAPQSGRPAPAGPTGAAPGAADAAVARPAAAQAVCGEVRPPRQAVLGEAEEVRRVAAEFLVDPADRDNLCQHCPSFIPYGWPTNLSALWLHAHSYSCEEWSFTCPPPAWAQEVLTQQ